MSCCGYNTVTPVKSDNSNEEHKDFEGPLKNRYCRDIIFLLLFVAYLGFMIYTTAVALHKGDAFRIVYGVDSWGNTCDRPNAVIDGARYSGRDMTGLKYSFYFNPAIFSGSGKSVVICTNACPEVNITSVADLQTLANQGTKLCRYDVAVSAYHNGQSDGLGSCPKLPLEETGEVLRRCVPKSNADALNSISQSLTSLLNTIDTNFAEKCVNDLERTWREIIYLCLIAFGLALAMLIFLRFFAGVIIWIMVIALGLGCLIATIFCWYTYAVLNASVNAKTSPTTAEQDEVRNWLIGAICATIIAAIILLVLLVLRSRIALVVQLFKEAGKAIGSVPFILAQPIWTLIILSGTVAGLIFVFMYIETASTPTVDDTNGHVTFTPNTDMQVYRWFFILGILWITEFIVASQEVVIASSVAIWFFTRDKSTLRTPILTSIYRLIRYHLGSVAIGSLIIALVKFARLILSYIEGKIRGKVGCVAVFCLKCLRCCLWCFEKALKFLNRNAYIVMAIHGYSFCKSARRAFSIIVSNALRMVAINCVGDFVLFLGKVGTVAAVACVGIELFKSRTDINYIWLPITMSCIFAYFIAGCFLDVYEMAIDTVFVCFAEDCEMNNGVTRPYFMSVGLMRFVENSRQAIAIAERREHKS
ncbi:choline transporter-like protein 1 [Liolophura sinensis]|uniref:choline transporter-like protein 1 n=1 Tax=Liolophura sinensis TaxID=3198878 RepID=UPI0031591740